MDSSSHRHFNRRICFPSELRCLVRSRYCAANIASRLIFSPTLSEVIQTSNGIPFLIRYNPSNLKKPTPNADSANLSNNIDSSNSSSTNKTSSNDPFLNPDPNLVVGDISLPVYHLQKSSTKPLHDNNFSPSHYIILNKFPIIEDHFLLVTRQFKQQDHLLEPEDLTLTHAILREWSRSPSQGSSKLKSDPYETSTNSSSQSSEIFAFFNSGLLSGASQPHRHIQFLPVDSMSQDYSQEYIPELDQEYDPEISPNKPCEWSLLIDRIVSEKFSTLDPSTGFYQNPELPFEHFGLSLPYNASSDQLHTAYLRLYYAAVACASPNLSNTENSNVFYVDEDDIKSQYVIDKLYPDCSTTQISYNLAMTYKAMVICPRRQASATIPAKLCSSSGNALTQFSQETSNGESHYHSNIDNSPFSQMTVSLNGSMLAGTVLVADKQLWDSLRKKPALLDFILAETGFPLLNSIGCGPSQLMDNIELKD